jgi:hypothetical protein
MCYITNYIMLIYMDVGCQAFIIQLLILCKLCNHIEYVVFVCINSVGCLR